jgi:hypothetical protein
VSDFIQKITDFNDDEYEYFYEIVQIYEIVQNEIVQNHFGNKKQSLSKKIIDDEFREKFYNKLELISKKLESFIEKYNLKNVVKLVQKYTIGNKKQGGHTDYPTSYPTPAPNRRNYLTRQESEILLYTFLPFIIIFVWILFVKNYRGIRRRIRRCITRGIEGSRRAITNGIERMEIFIRRLDFSFSTETVINDENTNDENTYDENLKCTKRDSRDSNNHTIIQVSDEINHEFDEINHELDDAIAHVRKPAIVDIDQLEQNDYTVAATPEEQNNDTVAATPEEQNDDTVEATPEEKNFLKFMLSFVLFSRTPYDQDFEGQNGGFTPLRIYNAQSVSPRSLLTAHKVGVLNVQRCNKRTIKKKKNKKNKKNTKNNYY